MVGRETLEAGLGQSLDLVAAKQNPDLWEAQVQVVQLECWRVG
jgi:hypothetical protein